MLYEIRGPSEDILMKRTALDLFTEEPSSNIGHVISYPDFGGSWAS